MPTFLTALGPRARHGIFLGTAIAFILWKSPWNSAPLEAWNPLGLWPLARVIDTTDWIALLSLLLAFRATLSAPEAPTRWWLVHATLTP